MTNKTTIFELERIVYDSWRKPKYPEFEVNRGPIGVFRNLAKAEMEMKKYAKGYPESLFGFMINELLLDKATYGDAIKRRSYLADGSFWDETLVSEICGETKNDRLEEFLGRPTEKIHFKEGDLVEYLFGERVYLGVIGGLPRTPEEVQQLHERNRSRKKNPDDYWLKLDYSDDGYDSLDQDGGHGHPDAINTFPVRLKVSKKLKEKFDNVYANPESWT
jgi:hypothetical protein